MSLHGCARRRATARDRKGAIRMRKLCSAVLLVILVTVSACSQAPPQAGDTQAIEPRETGPTTAQVASLLDVDVSTAATGPSVHELITVEDVKRIIGRDDIVFAEAT